MWTGISVIIRPTGELITLARLKARLRIDHSDDDDLLAELLKGAVARVEGPSGIGYALMEQTWRKSMDCFPCVIILPGAPIKSVTAITYVDTDGATQTLDSADYRIDVDSEPARIVPAYGTAWPSARHVIGAVKIDYRLGETDAANVEQDLIDAVCLIVAHRYENREAVLNETAHELPLGVQWILDEHVRGHVAA
ncbi:head-tail connector protein [Allomesorhizobium alhagi]|uniref:Phage gp6-like head-tail connector protein n=1 Tax=Mesorhizobium alhagi CCNWXJ12-2 TaxID=1107882 RepID=H0HR44_9HYPH|nr:head-tail connector protein [Mesorhizobium alhagi]EHK56824.1 hypothetical protein MAXJ12_13136 [Mesorhizobium alhagi CCNWXJ12-2]